jgi:CheY-like chemotaxis protein
MFATWLGLSAITHSTKTITPDARRHFDLSHGRRLSSVENQVSMRSNRGNQPAMRVLLVEDNLLVQALEADILSNSGHEVATATNAEEALQLLDAGTAVLITDIRLPGGVDGLALAQTARQRRPDLAIMLIGADVNDLAPKDLRRIADEALSKPFRVDEFEQRVATLARIVEAIAAVRGTPPDKLHTAVAAKEGAISERARIRACAYAGRGPADERR